LRQKGTGTKHDQKGRESQITGVMHPCIVRRLLENSA
jgi:hypothetical protein